MPPVRTVQTVLRWRARRARRLLGAAWSSARPRLVVTRRVRRWVVGGAVALVAAGCAGGLMAMVLARSAPAWWVTIVREDPRVVQVARTIENQVLSRLHQDRSGTGDGTWTLEIPADKANAWLNVRLPMWLANQKDEFRWPEEMSDLQVNFDDDQITIGARVRSGSREQVFTATIEPRLTEDGRVYIPARWVSVGRLPIPADWVIDQAHRAAGQYIPEELRGLPETEVLFKAFAGAQAIRNSPVIEVADGRAIRVLDFSCRDATLRITCRTERK